MDDITKVKFTPNEKEWILNQIETAQRVYMINMDKFHLKSESEWRYHIAKLKLWASEKSDI